jgi:hypothetical protein
MKEESTIVAELRVKSCAVGSFPPPPKKSSIRWNEKTEEVWEIKADGVWKPELPYPISLHFTAPPGHQVVPFIGKKLKITIEAL